jgi:hypothetical protein
MRKLQLSEWASVAEVISAIAVVVSLLYVGYQVNQNTKETRAANRQQLVDRAQSALVAAATSPELAGAVSKAANGTKLSQLELSQYGFFVRGMLKDMEEAYLLYQEGRLDETYWETRAAVVLSYMARTPARDAYRRDKRLGILHVSFVEWLDQAIQERYEG